MKQKTLDTFIQENPLLALGGVVIFIVIIGLAGLFINSLATRPPKNPQVAVVTFNDGQNTVTVGRNGLVTIRTPRGTYTQNWDPDKIRRFFAALDNLDFDQLTQFVGTGVAIQLTMNGGGTFNISINDVSGEVADTFEAALTNTYAASKSATLVTPKPLLPGITPQPTGVPARTPLPTPGGNNGGSTNPWQTGTDIKDTKTFGCGQVDAKTGKKVIVSNTVCMGQ
jgi:hypothetical protein